MRDRHRLRGVNDDTLGEGPGSVAVHDRLSFGVAKRRRLVEREHLFAEDRRALGAGRAEAAVADERHDHAVAGLEPGHARPTASTTPAASWP